MPTLFFEQALLPDGWASHVEISLVDGRIAAIVRDASPSPSSERHAVALPGMANVHSHAFQRGMSGLAEIRGPNSDSFWTWREVMYRFALSVTPDDVEAIAAQLYMEMLEAGFTRVGEFHYLHHDIDGRPYSNIAEMAERIALASQDTGIALTLLPVFYAHGGFGAAPPLSGQRRFICSVDAFATLLDASASAIRPLTNANLGVAPHSLRAVTPDELRHVVGLRDNVPVHIHAAEQMREVEECVAHLRARPVQWLLEEIGANTHWCFIHATHMTPEEARAMALAGVTAGLCPVTEANLGDGVFQGPAFLQAGGRFGVGSDSNVLIGIADELRQLEYGQRLSARERNVVALAEGQSSGRALFDGAACGGALALGATPAGLAAGAPADIVSLNMKNQHFAGLRGDRLLDAWIFATRGADIDSVWRGGVRCVVDGVHVHRQRIATRFAAVMRRLVA